MLSMSYIFWVKLAHMIETTLHTERQTLPLTILFENNLEENIKILGASLLQQHMWSKWTHVAES